MAFTEAQLVAQIDSTGTRRVVDIQDFVMHPDGLSTDIYAIGVVHPYAGRSRWVHILQSQTAAQAWTAIQTALA